MFALSGESQEPGEGRKEGGDGGLTTVLNFCGVSLLLLPSLPTGRGNDLLVECNCVHAIPFVPAKNGGKGSKIHRLTTWSAFSHPGIVSIPDDTPLTQATSKPLRDSLRLPPFVSILTESCPQSDCDSRFGSLRVSWWPALQFPGSKPGSLQRQRRKREDVHILEVLG